MIVIYLFVKYFHEFRICENKLITIISNLLGSFWAVKKRRRLLY